MVVSIDDIFEVKVFFSTKGLGHKKFKLLSNLVTRLQKFNQPGSGHLDK
jgi:hypothetical protein